MTKSSPTLVPTFLCHTFINIFLPFSLLSPVHCRDLCHRDTPLLSGSTCWDGNTGSPPSNPGHQPSCSSSSPGGVSPCRSSSWSRWCCLPRWPRDCGSNQSCTGQCRNFLQLKWFLSSTDHKLHFIEGSKLFLKSDSSVASICKYYLDTFLSSCESHTHKHSRRWGHRMMHWSRQELLLVVTWQLTSFKRVQKRRQKFSSIIVQESPLKKCLFSFKGLKSTTERESAPRSIKYEILALSVLYINTNIMRLYSFRPFEIFHILKFTICMRFMAKVVTIQLFKCWKHWDTSFSVREMRCFKPSLDCVSIKEDT